MLSQSRTSCPIFSFFILDPSARFLNHFMMAVIFANGQCQSKNMTFLSLAFCFLPFNQIITALFINMHVLGFWLPPVTLTPLHCTLYMPDTIGLLQRVQKFMSEDVNFVGIDFDPLSGLQKNLKMNSILSFGQAALTFCFPGATSYLPGPSLSEQVNFKSYLLSKKIYLSQTTKSDFF